jgi:hypothetical protein
MEKAVLFKPAAIEKKAFSLYRGEAKQILLFGGFRSGKTAVLVMVIIYRALCFEGSRYLIYRYPAKDVRSSFLRETG